MSTEVAVGSPNIQPAIDVPGSRVETGPGAQPPHLTPQALQRWRDLLELHWRACLERVTELSLAYHDAQEVSAHPAVSGYTDEAHAESSPATAGRPARPLLRLAVAERRALAEIEAALARLTNGGFGRCERCGGTVPAARLNRVPQTRYCGVCDQ